MDSLNVDLYLNTGEFNKPCCRESSMSRIWVSAFRPSVTSYKKYHTVRKLWWSLRKKMKKIRQNYKVILAAKGFSSSISRTCRTWAWKRCRMGRWLSLASSSVPGFGRRIKIPFMAVAVSLAAMEKMEFQSTAMTGPIKQKTNFYFDVKLRHNRQV